MDLFVIKNEDDFQSLREGWEKIYHPKLSVFQTWLLNYSWYIAYKNLVEQLFIICFGSQTNPQFILPTYINKKGVLQLLQHGSSDFLDAVYMENINFSSILSKTTDLIFNEKKIKEIGFINLRAYSPLVNYLPYILNKQNLIVLQGTIFTNIPEDLLKHETKIHQLIPSKKNGKLKKIFNSFSVNTEIRNINNYPFPAKEINLLIEKMEQSNIRSKNAYLQMLEFFKKVYNHGLLEVILNFNKDNLEILSASCIINYKNELLIWNDFFNPSYKNINIFKYLWLINYCKSNNLQINFGTGIYKYKIMNFVPLQESLFVIIHTKSKWRFIIIWLRKLAAKLLKLS